MLVQNLRGRKSEGLDYKIQNVLIKRVEAKNYILFYLCIPGFIYNAQV